MKDLKRIHVAVRTNKELVYALFSVPILTRTTN